MQKYDAVSNFTQFSETVGGRRLVSGATVTFCLLSDPTHNTRDVIIKATINSSLF